MLPTRVQVDVSVGDEEVDYRCSRCGVVMMATVSGSGVGLNVNARSLSNAVADARVGAIQATQLAPCPRCGHRSRVALAKVVLTGSAIGALAAFAVWLVVAERLHASDPGGDTALLLGLVTFFAVVTATTSLKLKRVARRVRFWRAAP